MNVYVYAGDLYCEECGEDIRKQLMDEGRGPDYPDDEDNYDSDDFPKGPYSDTEGINHYTFEADSPQHCGAEDDCMNSIEFPDGRKIGAWLENDLTAEGVEYVREAIQEGGEVAELWAELYRDYNLENQS